MTDHPITPPPELVEQWRTAPEYTNCREKLTMVSMTTRRLQEITDQAARWGADQELEACCADIHTVYGKDQADWLRSLRRPQSPSLKEQALKALDEEQAEMSTVNYKTIRAVLETLPD